MVVARVLIQLGRIEEGTERLDIAHLKIIKQNIGLDMDLARYNYVRGLQELALGDSNSALLTLKQALIEADRLNEAILLNRYLIALTKAELMNVKKSASLEIDSSGTWMTRLRNHAIERDYPGIKIQHALLKAEYQVLIDEHEAAILTLRDALTYSDSNGVKTLRERIHHQLKKLENK